MNSITLIQELETKINRLENLFQPRNSVIPLKSYLSDMTALDALQVETDQAEEAGDASPEKDETITINQEQLDRMVESAVARAAKVAEETILEMLQHRSGD